MFPGKGGASFLRYVAYQCVHITAHQIQTHTEVEEISDVWLS